MIKQQNLVKSSFTLLETLLSITLLALVIGGFSKSTYEDEISNKNYMLLNSLENSFDTKDYDRFTSSNQTIKLIVNSETIENLNVKKYEFLNEHIKLIKYEK